jgi:hypothetical protein
MDVSERVDDGVLHRLDRACNSGLDRGHRRVEAGVGYDIPDAEDGACVGGVEQDTADDDAYRGTT